MMPELRPEAIDLLDRVKNFINDEVKPKEHVFHDQILYHIEEVTRLPYRF